MRRAAALDQRLLEDAALLDAPARLAKRLLSLGEQHGEAGADGRLVRISQEELANFLGVSRQAVNEQLQDWKAKGGSPWAAAPSPCAMPRR